MFHLGIGLKPSVKYGHHSGIATQVVRSWFNRLHVIVFLHTQCIYLSVAPNLHHFFNMLLEVVLMFLLHCGCSGFFLNISSKWIPIRWKLVQTSSSSCSAKLGGGNDLCRRWLLLDGSKRLSLSITFGTQIDYSSMLPSGESIQNAAFPFHNNVNIKIPTMSNMISRMARKSKMRFEVHVHVQVRY